MLYLRNLQPMVDGVGGGEERKPKSVCWSPMERKEPIRRIQPMKFLHLQDGVSRLAAGGVM